MFATTKTLNTLGHNTRLYQILALQYDVKMTSFTIFQFSTRAKLLLNSIQKLEEDLMMCKKSAFKYVKCTISVFNLMWQSVLTSTFDTACFFAQGLRINTFQCF